MITYQEFVKQHIEKSALPTELIDSVKQTSTIGSFSDFCDLIHALGLSDNDDPKQNIDQNISPTGIFALELRYPFFVYKLDQRCNSYLSIDDLPNGWIKTILLPLCEDIRDICFYHDTTGTLLCQYALAQVKEKFGTLRWYDEFGFIEDEKLSECCHQILEDTHLVIEIAEAITSQVCIDCGSNKHIDLYGGWIHYECEKCATQRYSVIQDTPKPIRKNTRHKLVGKINLLQWLPDQKDPKKIDICATVMGKGFIHCLDVARELDKKLEDNQ